MHGALFTPCYMTWCFTTKSTSRTMSPPRVCAECMWAGQEDDCAHADYAVLSLFLSTDIQRLQITHVFCVCVVKSQSHIYDRRFTANQVILAPSPLRLTARDFFSQLNTYGHSPCITSSLTRGWVGHLQFLLALASPFILGSESHGTREHILLSQIRDFPFCHLLRLAGLRWRYSTPPPHGKYLCSKY
jgi:hypothetical protein